MDFRSQKDASKPNTRDVSESPSITESTSEDGNYSPPPAFAEQTVDEIDSVGEKHEDPNEDEERVVNMNREAGSEPSNPATSQMGDANPAPVKSDWKHKRPVQAVTKSWSSNNPAQARINANNDTNAQIFFASRASFWVMVAAHGLPSTCGPPQGMFNLGEEMSGAWRCPVQGQHSSAAVQRYASAPNLDHPGNPVGSAPQATYDYDSNIYQPQYKPLPPLKRSTTTQRYASAPILPQPTYTLGSAPQSTYTTPLYQPQYQSASFTSPQNPATVPSNYRYSTSLQNPSTLPSNYQYTPQSSHELGPQSHASSAINHPLPSSNYAVAAPLAPIGLPSTAQLDSQLDPSFQSTFQQQAPHLQVTVPIESQQPHATADRLASVVVQDGEEPQSFSNAKLITSYLRLFPEAENDQGCRIFKYGPKCSSQLLLPLFEHFDFPRYALFPYGFANDFAAERTTNAGICRCQRCTEDRPCGHYVLQHHFHFYLLQNSSQSAISTPPQVAVDSSSVVISSRSSQYKFFMADWNLQVFRFRSHRIETTEFAYDALIYQNYENVTRLRSSPLDYLLSQVDIILNNWDTIINASSEFLLSFVSPRSTVRPPVD
ncbi:MAG: hypothetical protein Q9195_006657 [Heterodermia aff. obscurata]